MNHLHRWLVEPPNGEPVLNGVCRCGKERTFEAYITAPWKRLRVTK